MGDLTLLQAVEEYKEIYLAYRNFAQRTRVEYINDLEDLVQYLEDIGVHKTGDVTLSNLVRYIADLEKRGYAGSTRKRKVISIRSFFGFLHMEGYIITDFAKRLIVPFVEAKTPRYLSTNEVDQLLKSAKSNKRDYSIIQLLLHTGIKLSELVGLTVNDLYTSDMTDMKGNKIEYVQIKSSRHGKGRVIPVNLEALKAIVDYLVVRGESLSDSMFLNRSGECLGIRGVEKILEKYLARSRIKNASVNSLRHTFGAHLTSKGTSIKTIQKVMGVRDIRTVRYFTEL